MRHMTVTRAMDSKAADVKRTACRAPGCSTRPFYNTLGSVWGAYCVKHKSYQMINVRIGMGYRRANAAARGADGCDRVKNPDTGRMITICSARGGQIVWDLMGMTGGGAEHADAIKQWLATPEAKNAEAEAEAKAEAEAEAESKNTGAGAGAEAEADADAAAVAVAVAVAARDPLGEPSSSTDRVRKLLAAPAPSAAAIRLMAERLTKRTCSSCSLGRNPPNRGVTPKEYRHNPEQCPTRTSAKTLHARCNRCGITPVEKVAEGTLDDTLRRPERYLNAAGIADTGYCWGCRQICASSKWPVACCDHCTANNEHVPGWASPSSRSPGLISCSQNHQLELADARGASECPACCCRATAQGLIVSSYLAGQATVHCDAHNHLEKQILCDVDVELACCRYASQLSVCGMGHRHSSKIWCNVCRIIADSALANGMVPLSSDLAAMYICPEGHRQTPRYQRKWGSVCGITGLSCGTCNSSKMEQIIFRFLQAAVPSGQWTKFRGDDQCSETCIIGAITELDIYSNVLSFAVEINGSQHSRVGFFNNTATKLERTQANDRKKIQTAACCDIVLVVVEMVRHKNPLSMVWHELEHRCNERGIACKLPSWCSLPNIELDIQRVAQATRIMRLAARASAGPAPKPSSTSGPLTGKQTRPPTRVSAAPEPEAQQPA